MQQLLHNIVIVYNIQPCAAGATKETPCQGCKAITKSNDFLMSFVENCTDLFWVTTFSDRTVFDAANPDLYLRISVISF